MSRFDAGHGCLVVDRDPRATWPPRSASRAARCAVADASGTTPGDPAPSSGRTPDRRRPWSRPEEVERVALWRVHVELEDRPGRLGELATAVGGAGCNIISLHVVGEPADDGSVTDELLVKVPDGGRPGRAGRRDASAAGIPCTLLVRGRRHRAGRPRHHGARAGPDGRRRPGQRAARGGHDAARPARRPGRSRARRATSTRCASAPSSCGWAGRGRSPPPSCPAPPRCWSWPPSSRCARRPGRPAAERILLLRDGSEVRLRRGRPVGRAAGGRAARALLPGDPPRPVPQPRPRSCRRASWPSCSAATERARRVLAVTTDGGSAVGRGHPRRRPGRAGARAGSRCSSRTPGRAAGWAPRCCAGSPTPPPSRASWS